MLTPHAGEFARLAPDLAQAAQGEAPDAKAEATRAAAQRFGCTVLLKGAETCIATPEGEVLRHRAEGVREAPWLATAGAGDVLAGFITGLLARGIAPAQAAALGTWLHVETALRHGPGLIAEDLPERLPAVLRDVMP